MNREEFRILFVKYTENECSEQELRQFFWYVNDPTYCSLFEQLLEKQLESNVPELHDMQYWREMERSFDHIDQHLARLIERPKRKRLIPLWLPYAAASILLFICGLYFLQHHFLESPPDGQIPIKTASELFVGNQRLPLDTTQDSHKIIFRDKQVIISQEGAELLKIDAFETGQFTTARPIVIKVANGRILKLKLVDGSFVTINSGSTLRLPIAFDSLSRPVELQGEGYFEVASHKNWPFQVKTAGQFVEVYGTTFNVRDYADGSLAATSLLKGKVSVKKIAAGKIKTEMMIKPGEKVLATKNSQVLEKVAIGAKGEETAWTQGMFSYNNTPLKEIMGDFSRWYSVDVDWDAVPDLSFQGSISKSYSVQQAISFLNISGNMHIKLNNNQITF